MPWGVRIGGRGPPRTGGRSGRAASLVSGSSKKSNSMSVSRSVMAPCREKGAASTVTVGSE